MNYSQIRQYDVANGIGIRTTLFVSGCTHNCNGCFNKEYQMFNNGNVWTEYVEQHFINLGKDEVIAGYSILGGEPFQQNPSVILSLLKNIKQQTNKSIWLWTGYTYDDIPNEYIECLKYIDVLVDGKFIENLKDIRLSWRGSSNQRVIDVNKTLNKGVVVIYENL